MPLNQQIPRAVWPILLDRVLEGLRQGGVPPWPTGRWPRLKRCLEQHWLGPIWGAWGDQVADHERWPSSVRLLIHWSCGLIRPDHESELGLERIPTSAWVEQTTWRPLLAVATISGLLSVPDLPRHYRRKSGESAVDTLCGLWAVGNSTTYRYAEKGRRLLTDAVIDSQGDSDRQWALREVAAKTSCLSLGPTWHLKQAQLQGQHGHPMDAAWHLCHAEQWLHLAELLTCRALELVSEGGHTALSRYLRRADVAPKPRVNLALAESSLWRCKGDSSAELACLQLALRTIDLVPSNTADLCAGQVHYALGYFYNSREPDRAIGHLEAAAQHFLAASQSSQDTEFGGIQSAYVATLALLSFINFRRNSPQAHALLRSALAASKECDQLNLEAKGMLLKAQSEEARCRDEWHAAISFRQQTLALYERAADLKEVVECFCNLGQLLAQAGRGNEAKDYCQRVIDMSRRLSIRPETQLAAHGGMALAAMSLSEHELAIKHLHHVLRISMQFGLQMHQLSGLMNLAEVHYLRFKEANMAQDEVLGDQYVEKSHTLAIRLGLPQLQTKAQSLKQATLNPQTATHHLLPIETSAHPGEFAKIEALRAELALPRPPAQRARTHIALSQLYLRIAAKERDAARGLMQTHGLGELEADIEALQQTWAHDGNLASQLSSRWREQVGDWLTDSQRKAVLERLLAEGSLSKSSYGEAAEVSPATASKHLGLLADKGLLEQQGRGPATRYVLPSGQHSGSRDGAASTRSPGSVH